MQQSLKLNPLLWRSDFCRGIQALLQGDSIERWEPGGAREGRMDVRQLRPVEKTQQ